jgi:hypothetical protein
VVIVIMETAIGEHVVGTVEIMKAKKSGRIWTISEMPTRVAQATGCLSNMEISNFQKLWKIKG